MDILFYVMVCLIMFAIIQSWAHDDKEINLRANIVEHNYRQDKTRTYARQHGLVLDMDQYFEGKEKYVYPKDTQHRISFKRGLEVLLPGSKTWTESVLDGTESI